MEVMLFLVSWVIPLTVVTYVIYLLVSIRDAVVRIDSRLARESGAGPNGASHI